MPDDQEEKGALDEEEEQSMDDSDEDKDSNDGEHADAEQLARVVVLQTQLAENPYLYEAHKELIKLYKELGELEDLRKARRAMSRLFPLTEDLWLDWITDEKCLISTAEEKEDLLKLLGLAVEDYISVTLWLEYCTFAIGCGNMERIRSIMASALDAAGSHITDGKLLWDVCLEYEKAVLSSLQPQLGECPSEQQMEEIKSQTERIQNLFVRQLRIPLIGMGSCLSEYKEWCEEVTPDVEESYSQAAELLMAMGKYEAELSNAQTDESKAKVYQTYLDYCLLNVKDTACIRCLFERAVKDCCLNQVLWLHYGEFLERSDVEDGLVLRLYTRSVRNCPWSGALWVAYCRAAEKHHRPYEHIRELFESALQSGLTQSSEYLDLWCAYIDFLRRIIDWSNIDDAKLLELRTTFDRATQHLLTYYGEQGDGDCIIPKYWALIEAKFLKDMERARQIWNDMMIGWRRDKAEAWLEFYRFERAYGDHKHCRRVLQRAMKAVTDWPMAIGNEYVRFEREEGTLDQLYVALARAGEISKKVTAENLKREEQFVKHKPKVKSAPKVKAKSQQPSDDKSIKRHRNGESVNRDDNRKTAVKRKMDESEQMELSSPVTAVKSQTKDPDFAMPAIPPAVKKAKPDHSDIGDKQFEHIDSNTAFVSNLSFDISEDQLRHIFSKCGEVKEIRIMKARGDKPKGFAYVEFYNTESAVKARSLDRELIGQRPMFVSECNPNRDTKEKKLKFDTGMEKTKLFISGLSYATTKEELEEFVSKHGKVKEARIVTYKGGNSKGLAYVEMFTEEDARTAVMALDGAELRGFNIKVAISNPPPRKDKFVPSLGGASRHEADSLPRGRGRTQLSLVPRVMQKKPQSANQSAEVKGSAKQLTDGTDSTVILPCNEADGPAQAPLSNADFRNFLLKK